jgi:transcriptional regulator
MPKHPLSVVKGTLEYLVLQTLSTGDALHGFEILDWITEAAGDDLVIEEGALYPALHRMEERCWLTAEWGVSTRGRRAKYYTLTRKGRTALAREETRWNRYVAAVARIAMRSGEA